MLYGKDMFYDAATRWQKNSVTLLSVFYFILKE